MEEAKRTVEVKWLILKYIVGFTVKFNNKYTNEWPILIIQMYRNVNNSPL